MPLTIVNSYQLDITCYPPQPTAVPQDIIARWKKIESLRLEFGSDHIREIFQGPPIPWRANLDDYCDVDRVQFVHYPYPVPFVMNQSGLRSGEVRAHCDDNNHTTTPSGISVSFGGLIYNRAIAIALEHRQSDWCYWGLTLWISSRDGEWLASLSRTDAAALISLNSVFRVIGWMYPERNSIKNGVVFYAKTFYPPGLQPSDQESPRYEQPSPLGAAYDEEMRQLVDGGIEMLIRGGD